MTDKPLCKCLKCKKWINPAFGLDGVSEHQEAIGTRTDPRAPGDWDDVCAVCYYNSTPRQRLTWQARRLERVIA